MLPAACSPTPSPPGNDNAANEVIATRIANFIHGNETEADKAWYRAEAVKRCPKEFAQISEHPEADAQAAFAKQDHRFLFIDPGGILSIPGIDGNDVPDALNSHGKRARLIAGVRDDGGPCMEFGIYADEYAQRYNLELKRLARQGIEHRHERD